MAVVEVDTSRGKDSMRAGNSEVTIKVSMSSHVLLFSEYTVLVSNNITQSF